MGLLCVFLAFWAFAKSFPEVPTALKIYQRPDKDTLKFEVPMTYDMALELAWKYFPVSETYGGADYTDGATAYYVCGPYRVSVYGKSKGKGLAIIRVYPTSMVQGWTERGLLPSIFREEWKWHE